MKDTSKIWIWALLVVLTILLWFMYYKASKVTSADELNPQYIPVIMNCSNYNSDCGQRFKEVLALYDYKICALPNYTVNVCDLWYSPEDLHIIFNALPGWFD